MITTKHYFPGSLLFALLLACAPQVSALKKKAEFVPSEQAQVATIEDTDALTSLAIDLPDGEASLDIPPGLLDVGSQVTLDSINEPQSFSDSGTQAASGAIAIQILDSNGELVEDLSEPMNLRLPLTATSLKLTNTLAPAHEYCVFLKSWSGQLLFWQGADVFLGEDNQSIAILTKKTGIFQARLCPAEQLPQIQATFSSAVEQNIAGARVDLVFTIPSDFIPEETTDLCIIVAKATRRADGGQELQPSTVLGTAQLSQPFAGDHSFAFPLPVLLPEDFAMIAYVFSTEGCSVLAQNRALPDNLVIKHQQIVAKFFTFGELQATPNQTVGEGSWAMHDLDLNITPRPSTAANSQFSNAGRIQSCLRVEASAPEGSGTYLSAELDLRASAIHKLPLPSLLTASIRVYTGMSCTMAEEIETDPSYQTLATSLTSGRSLLTFNGSLLNQADSLRLHFQEYAAEIVTKSAEAEGYFTTGKPLMKLFLSANAERSLFSLESKFHTYKSSNLYLVPNAIAEKNAPFTAEMADPSLASLLGSYDVSNQSQIQLFRGQ